MNRGSRESIASGSIETLDRKKYRTGKSFMDGPSMASVSLDSMNSHPYDESSILKLVQKQIKSHKIEIPPTRESLAKLFDALNLSVTTTKILDCLIFCRGQKMDSDDF